MQKHKIFKISILILVLFSATAIVPYETSCATNFASSEREPEQDEKKDRRSSRKKKKVRWVRSKWGIKMLMLMNKDQGKMKKIYAEEDESYRSIKKAIDHNVLSEGYPAFEIKKKFGEPVIELLDTDGASRWVYKPSSSSYFDGEKAYLFFTSSGELLGWELVAAKEPVSAVE